VEGLLKTIILYRGYKCGRANPVYMCVLMLSASSWSFVFTQCHWFPEINIGLTYEKAKYSSLCLLSHRFYLLHGSSRTRRLRTEATN
jgi:hypothetical protein